MDLNLHLECKFLDLEAVAVRQASLDGYLSHLLEEEGC